ncbi:MAG: YihY family inner membrane protein [Myxococcaceae bacterium]|nr:YihY family inner membrane protein [Myxococcaceae bacterium]MCI0671836.1 YihY family inner membrane protein [Myxococcaceae bacterium]
MADPKPLTRSRARRRTRWEALLLRLYRPFHARPAGRFLSDTFFAARAVVRSYRGERLDVRAAALTSVTLFSLVPLVSVALGLLHALAPEELEQRLRGLISSLLAPGVRAEGAVLLDGFLRTAGSSAVGSLGFALLVLSSASLLRQLDAALNELWHVRRPRPLPVRLALYALILVLGPLLAALSLLTTGVLRDVLLMAPPLAPVVQLPGSVGRAFLAVLALTGLYKLAPNASVRWSSALTGAVFAGLAWELVRHGYNHFATRIFQVDPIYGSLGALPLFLAWVYVSWLAVLSGARLAYAVEVASLRALGVSVHLLHHPRARALVAARVAQVTTLAFLSGAPPPRPRELALRFRVTEGLLEESVSRMEEAGLVTLTWRNGVQPARDPSALTLEDVARAVGVRGLERTPGPLEEPLDEEFSRMERYFLQADAASAEHLARLTWTDLAGLLDPAFPTTVRAPTLPARREGRNP